MKLSDCTSSICNDYNGDYCPECSHSIYRGRGKDHNGKLWRWDFVGRFGPLFVDKDREPLENQPDMDSPAWDVFDRWHKRFKKPIKEEGDV